MIPVHRLGTSPRPQPQCLHMFFLQSSSHDHRAGDDGGSTPLVKPEEASEARIQKNPLLASPSSLSTIRTAMLDGDEFSGNGYGMGWMSPKMNADGGSSDCSVQATPESKVIRDVIHTEDRAAVTMNVGGNSGNHTTRVCSDCNTTRVCSDCNTTTTPLWRSGPRGPKSLCNACGIRQRKARRAMEEAAAGGFSPASPSSVTCRINGIKVHNKEKKSRGAGHSLLGSTCKRTTKAGGSDGLFGDFSALRGAFPRDVTEAAILLMDLSCGFAHT